MGDHSAELEIDTTGERKQRKPPVWVIGVIAAAAGFEILATWIGVGSLSGFPVYGIGKLHVPTDWTLAVGMEAYAGVGLWAWLTVDGENSRRFSGCSAIFALLLSLVVQVSYHLMLADGDHRAPKVLVAIVSGLPLTVLTLGAILIHMMLRDAEAARSAARKAHETDERTLLRQELAGARQAHGDAVRALSADLESARQSAQHEASVRAETAETLAAVREELRTARAEWTRAEEGRQAAARQREEDVSAARREIDATRAQLDQARANAAMRPVIEAERERARADASAAETARAAAEAARESAERALARAQARAETAERKLADAAAAERTDAHGEDLTRLPAARARERAREILDAKEGMITGGELAARFGLSKRWGETRKQEWLALRSGGAEGLRAVGED